ncbi:MAG TPA: uroporphyrinogen-III synthase [Burkholderiales bacterium]|nr:uroporphyrinogen-III synthase [Burkholderiales bacterium]
MGASALAGRGVVVTRPADQAGALARLIEAAGGRALVYPAMDIEDLAPSPETAELIARLEEFDLAIFVSPTAARKALALVRARRDWPSGLRAAAIGGGTRAELQRHGIEGAIVPRAGADSEALLSLPQLAGLSGKRVAIFRGEGGRALLAETLRSRGARVQLAECYRRKPPKTDFRPLASALDSNEVHAVTSFSSAGLRYLLEALGETAARRLRGTPLFAAHERIGEQARRLGIGTVLVAGPGDAQMLARVVAYFEAP